MQRNRGWKLGGNDVGMAIAVALVAWTLAACGSLAPAEAFRVEIGPEGAYVPRMRAGAFRISVQREGGFAGPVTVALPHPPVGVTAEGRVEAGADEGELLVTMGPDAALGPVALELVATGRGSGGVAVRREVRLVLTVLDEVRPTRYLVSAAGSPPPAEVYEEIVVPDNGSPWRLELVVMGGVLVLDPAGTYEHLLTIDTLQDGRLVGRSRWADHGAWVGAGPELAFTSTWIDGHAFTGSHDGADVVVDFDLQPFVGSNVTAELVYAE